MLITIIKTGFQIIFTLSRNSVEGYVIKVFYLCFLDKKSYKLQVF